MVARGGSSISQVEGGDGAGNAGSGAANTGGISVGGAGSVGGASGSGPAERPCADSDALAGYLDVFKTRGVATGTNGAFEDTCDADGNLVETTCERVCSSNSPAPAEDETPAPYPRLLCPGVTTGNVLMNTVPCGGLCVDGTCFYWCPEMSDTLLVEAIDELDVTFRSPDFVYRCTTMEPACADTSLVGNEEGISHLISCGPDTVTMRISLGEPGALVNCEYECSWE